MPIPLPKPELPPRTILSVQVPPRLAECIQAEARKDDRTPSYIVRRILAAHYRVDPDPARKVI
jgi:hypothetical protein